MLGQILAMRRARELSMWSATDENVKSLVEEGFSKEDAENALRKLDERETSYKYDYTWKEKRRRILLGIDY